jgi:hypothetical protein
VGIALGYRLDDRGSRVRFPAGAGNFSLHHRVRNGSVATQPPIQWVPGALFLGVKRPVREADHSPPSSAEVKECVELYLHSPIRLHGVVLSEAQGQLYLLLYFTLLQTVCKVTIRLNTWRSKILIINVSFPPSLTEQRNSGCKRAHFHSFCILFESRAEHRLFGMAFSVVFLSSSRRTSEQCYEIGPQSVSFQSTSCALLAWCYVTSVADVSSLNKGRSKQLSPLSSLTVVLALIFCVC